MPLIRMVICTWCIQAIACVEIDLIRNKAVS